jgi:hypothetical protein
MLPRELEARALMMGAPAIEIRGSMPTVSVVQILTASIAPVIVISGVGLLLLSITKRYGRVIDRARLRVWDLAEIRCLLRGQLAVPSEHFLLKRTPMIERQDVQGLVEGWFIRVSKCHAVSFSLR